MIHPNFGFQMDAWFRIFPQMNAFPLAKIVHEQNKEMKRFKMQTKFEVEKNAENNFVDWKITTGKRKSLFSIISEE